MPRDDGRSWIGGVIHDRTPIGAIQDARGGDWDRVRGLGGRVVGTLLGSLAGPAGGAVGGRVGSWIGRGGLNRALGRMFSGGGRMSRDERAHGAPLSPSPEMVEQPEALRDALGLTDWMRDFPGFTGTTVGIGPPGGQTGVEYDPDYFANLVAGYLNTDPGTGGERASGGGRGGGGPGGRGGGAAGSHGALGDSIARGGAASIGAALGSRIASMQLGTWRNKNTNRSTASKS